MSYYGIKNLKIVQTEDGKYNVACSYYDSSITDCNNNRVWHTTESLFKEGTIAKAELEYNLFKDFLDGNFHVSGNCGKFNCLSWTNNKVVLSKEESDKIQELHDTKDSLLYGQEAKAIKEQLRILEIPYEEWKNHPLYKDLHEKQVKAVQEYEDYRYNTYLRAWIEYLKQEKAEKKNKQYYVVKLDFMDNIGVFIRTNKKLCFSISYAKVFHKSLNQVLRELAGYKANPNFHNIQILNVTPYIQKCNRTVYASLDSTQEAQLKPEAIIN
jgi:hypothetical protein